MVKQSPSSWLEKMQLRPRTTIFVLCLLLHLAGTWAIPLIDRDEPRFAEAAREMIERRDFIVPYFNNDYRFDKPPLIYWLQVPCYLLLGENDFAARLPSSLAAALTALVIFGMGRRMFDAQTGFRAAIIFSFCLQTMMLAKAATADMVMILWVTVTMALGWRIFAAVRASEKVTWALWLGYYCALALGFLAKGPIAWIAIGALPLAGVWTGTRGLNRTLALWFGLPLALGLVAIWGIPAMQQTNGEYFNVGIGKHVVKRSISAMEGHGSKNALSYIALLPLYFLTVFGSFFPWSLKLVPAARYFLGAGGKDMRVRFLIAPVLLVFVIFSLLKTKLPHYTLPAFPMMALLMAHWLGQRPDVESWFRRCWAGVAIVAAVLFLVVAPFAAPLFPAWQLARISAPHLKPEMEFASEEFEEPSLVWYFRKHVDGFYSKPSPKKFPKYMAEKGPRFCVLPTGEVSTILPDADPAWKRFDVRGINVAKGRLVELTMFIKEE